MHQTAEQLGQDLLFFRYYTRRRHRISVVSPSERTMQMKCGHGSLNFNKYWNCRYFLYNRETVLCSPYHRKPGHVHTVFSMYLRRRVLLVVLSLPSRAFTRELAQSTVISDSFLHMEPDLRTTDFLPVMRKGQRSWKRWVFSMLNIEIFQVNGKMPPSIFVGDPWYALLWWNW